MLRPYRDCEGGLAWILALTVDPVARHRMPVLIIKDTLSLVIFSNPEFLGFQRQLPAK